MLRTVSVLSLLCVISTGCGDVSSTITPDDMPPESNPKADVVEGVTNTLPTLKNCTSASAPKSNEEDWRHTRTKLFAGVSSADHSAQDVITTNKRDVVIEGKFAYGRVSKDLEDEWVDVYLDDCSGAYVKLTEVLTDTDGRIGWTLKSEELPAFGVYNLFFAVRGDGSSVRSQLSVLPEGTKLSVFDIDGTLTTKDAEIFGDALADYFAPVLRGELVPESRPKAKEVTLTRAAQGHRLIYLTGRPYVLTRITREWLSTQGYAPGHVHVTNSNSEILPTNDSVGSFKRAYLLSLKAQGFELALAYGNATTDIYAYAEAGVSSAQTYIAGPHGGESQTQAVGDGYEEHLTQISAQPPIEQPFILP